MASEDYAHRDDYDPPDANWMDITLATSPWEVEFDQVRDDYRYRSKTQPGPWIKGCPPK